MRQLHDYERPLVTSLFGAIGLKVFDSLRVSEADDGVGSLIFQSGSSITRFGISKRYFIDEDGALVIAALNATSEDKPVELEFSKADSSSVIKWPVESAIFEAPPNKSLNQDAQ